jgi:hypothetical protein
VQATHDPEKGADYVSLLFPPSMIYCSFFTVLDMAIEKNEDLSKYSLGKKSVDTNNWKQERYQSNIYFN